MSSKRPALAGTAAAKTMPKNTEIAYSKLSVNPSSSLVSLISKKVEAL
ncbi:MAG TPA: hypothetical protein VEH06_12355 [Candidatus Bathyarchaeia archaeon]|nr:hypothetical protein [Candidatus Bathyarchaeia archaeon]